MSEVKYNPSLSGYAYDNFTLNEATGDVSFSSRSNWNVGTTTMIQGDVWSTGTTTLRLNYYGAALFDFASFRAMAANNTISQIRIRLHSKYGSNRTVRVHLGKGISALSGNGRPTNADDGHGHTLSYKSFTVNANAWGEIVITDQQWLDAVLDPDTTCIYISMSDTGTQNHTYDGYYFEAHGSSTTYKPELYITWVPSNPSLTNPSVPAQGTVTDDPHTFDWGDSSDSNGVFTSAQLYYTLAISFNGGASWSYFDTPQGQSSLAVAIRALLGIAAGHYYWNNNVKISIQAKTPTYNGVIYYSGWVESNIFTVDYTAVSGHASVPAVSTVPTITGNSYDFDWSDSYDINGTPGAISYDMAISDNGGASWTYYSDIPSSHYNLDIHTWKSLQTRQYYYNNTFRVAVRAKVTYNGNVYSFDEWGYSNFFVVDYRITPTAPLSPALSKPNPYEGETVNVSVNRPSNYNEKKNDGTNNELVYVFQLNGSNVAQVVKSVTELSVSIPYVVGNLTSGLNDLNTTALVWCYDAAGTSPPTGNMNITIKRFRAPTITVTNIVDRTEDSVKLNINLSDLGFGSYDIPNQLRKIEYNHDGSWHDAILDGAWSGSTNSFHIEGILKDQSYTVSVRVTNKDPGTGLGDKVSSSYIVTVKTYMPDFWAWRDSNSSGSRASTGAFARSLIVGDNPGQDVSPGWGYFQNGINFGAAGHLYLPNALLSLHIGDDIVLGDLNVSNTLFVVGAENNDRGYINFGTSTNNALGCIVGQPLKFRGNTIWDAGNLVNPFRDTSTVAVDTNALLTVGQMYRVDSTTTNKPSGFSDYGAIINFGGDSTFLTQLAFGRNGAIFNRGFASWDGLQWKPWQRVFDTDYFANNAVANKIHAQNGAQGIVCDVPGGTNGQKGCLSFNGTFENIGDTMARRCADIYAGFAGGAWNTERLYFAVGGAGDSRNLTALRMWMDVSYVWVQDGITLTAQTIVDRTPHFEGDALSEIAKIKGDGKGNIDHSTLPRFVHKTLKRQEATGELEEDGRDLGAMISVLTVAVQQQIAINKKLSSDIMALQALVK